MQNELAQLVQNFKDARYAVACANRHPSMSRAMKMTRLALLGAAKRKLRREMDRVERELYSGGTRADRKESIRLSNAAWEKVL